MMVEKFGEGTSLHVTSLVPTPHTVFTSSKEGGGGGERIPFALGGGSQILAKGGKCIPFALSPEWIPVM